MSHHLLCHTITLSGLITCVILTERLPHPTSHLCACLRISRVHKASWVHLDVVHPHKACTQTQAQLDAISCGPWTIGGGQIGHVQGTIALVMYGL